MQQRLDHVVLLGGRYRLVRPVGGGGMGTVWEAEDTILGRSVAVKSLPLAFAADERAVRRLEREARAAARLSDPRIAHVYDYGDGDLPHIVMELVEGETLAQRIRRQGRIDPAEAATIAADVAGALQSAHDAGVVHRDVKPANVMLTDRGE